MSKTLDKMTKAELIELVNKLSGELSFQAGFVLQLRSDKERLCRELEQLRRPARPMESLAAKAQRYCKAHGTRAVDRETLLHWQG